MTDEFGSMGQSPMTPSEYPFEVTPSDTADLERVTKALYIGTGGDVALRAKDTGNGVITFRNVPAGAQLQVRATRIMAGGTTASDIVGMA